MPYVLCITLLSCILYIRCVFKGGRHISEALRCEVWGGVSFWDPLQLAHERHHSVWWQSLWCYEVSTNTYIQTYIHTDIQSCVVSRIRWQLCVLLNCRTPFRIPSNHTFVPFPALGASWTHTALVQYGWELEMVKCKPSDLWRTLNPLQMWGRACHKQCVQVQECLVVCDEPCLLHSSAVL